MNNIYFVDVDKKLIILVMVLILAAMVPVYKNVVDIGAGVTHENHEDTLTTPLPGNCPNCNYPDCGGCGGQPQITLMPTEIIVTIPPFPDPATPDIPDPVQYPTIYPTFHIPTSLIPTALSTVRLPTIQPTHQPPSLPPSPVPIGQ